MLLSEFQDAMHRVGVDYPWATGSNMHAIAEAIYGGAVDPVTGSDLVPGGLPGHDAVAKLIKKNLAVFCAVARLRENDMAENVSRNLELSEAKAQKILDDREIAQLRVALEANIQDVGKRNDAMNVVKRELFAMTTWRDEARAERGRARIMISIYQALYGDAVLEVVKNAATGRRLKAELGSRCENDRPRVEELQALMVE